MEQTKGSISILQQLEKWADNYRLPIFGAHGSLGLVLTFAIAIAIPLLLSMLLIGKRKNRQRAVPVEVGGEEGFAMRNRRFTSLVESPWQGATTLAALFEQSCKKHRNDRYLGTRMVIDKETITASDGRKFEKLHLGEYQWQTYGEVYERVCNFASGLVKFGHDLNSRAAIYSETRADWFIALQGFMRQNVTVVTMYASLGEDALIHSLNETRVTTLICDSKQFKKVAAIRSRLETVKHVIYFEEDKKLGDAGISTSIDGLEVSSFADVEKLGKDNPIDARLPSEDDIAVIMYTSGSTGMPKGVMMTQKNVVATAASVLNVIPGLGSKDTYLAYLPLAHILEMEAEIVMAASGAAIGYGSALTLTDTSNKVKKGTKGDASMLEPTLMAAVPAILDRVRDGVLTKVNQSGGFVKTLFNIAFSRRLAAMEGSWLGAWGLEKLLWDTIVFRKVRSALGGKIRYMLCGGAPLSGDSQRFINICMGAPIGQAYGLTETCAGGTFSEWDDTSVGRVGPPLPCCYVKLVSWEEGGYRSSDKPMPRGEIVIGGVSVTPGYFNNEEKTKEVYKVDEKGIRWFYTGDIGQFHPDGCLEIIDRKKDIVKLQHGEYVSLGKVEAAMVLSRYVDNLMVYADPFHNFCVALVIPSRHALEKWAQEASVEYKSFDELCNNAAATKEVLKSMNEVAKEARLEKWEVPAKIKLLAEPWTPESGLVTAAFKIKREPIKAKFNDDLQSLYK